MTKSYKESLKDVEFIQRSRTIEWISRHPTSALIDPQENLMNGDLLINRMKHIFHKRLFYKLELFPGNEAECAQGLLANLKAKGIKNSQIVSKSLTKKKLKLRDYNCQLYQAMELIKQKHYRLQAWAIQAHLGISKRIIREAQQRVRLGKTPFICKRGRKQAISDAEIYKLKQAQQRGQMLNLSSKKIQEKILGRHSKQLVKISSSNFRRYLKKSLGLSYKNFTYIKNKTNKSDLIAQRKDYAQHVIPQLVRGIRLIFIDETSCWDCDLPKKNRLPKGKAVMKEANLVGQKYSIIGAVNEDRLEGYMAVPQRVHAEQYMSFLSELLLILEKRYHQKDCLLICDNAVQHNAKIAQDTIYAQVLVLFLLPYSPQLNPIELVWASFKKNLACESVNDEMSLLRAINSSFKKISSVTYKKNFMHSMKFLHESILGQPLKDKPSVRI